MPTCWRWWRRSPMARARPASAPSAPSALPSAAVAPCRSGPMRNFQMEKSSSARWSPPRTGGACCAPSRPATVAIRKRSAAASPRSCARKAPRRSFPPSVKNSALAGRGIVVTRPRELAAAIESAGGSAILFPTIAIEDAPPPEALGRLDAYDLAVFVSPTAVQKVMGQVQKWPKRLQAAAIGSGSRRELERRGVSGVLAPEEGADSEALLALPGRGASVEYAECYRRVLAKTDPAPLLARWQRDGVHAVTVSSSEGLENFVTLVGAAHLAVTPIFVPHARVAARAKEHGAREVVVSGPADAAVLERLVAYFHERA